MLPTQLSETNRSRVTSHHLQHHINPSHMQDLKSYLLLMLTGCLVLYVSFVSLFYVPSAPLKKFIWCHFPIIFNRVISSDRGERLYYWNTENHHFRDRRRCYE